MCLKLKYKTAIPEFLSLNLFTGGCTLNAIMDEATSLWHLKQSDGSVEPKLRDKQWTSFKMLFNDVATYYKNRNVEITEDA